MEHYRCVTCYFPRTRTTRICETVTFLTHEVPFPKVNLQDHLKQAAEDIITILTQPPNSTTLSLQEGDTMCNALLDLAQQLKRVGNIPEPTAAVQQQQKKSNRHYNSTSTELGTTSEGGRKKTIGSGYNRRCPTSEGGGTYAKPRLCSSTT